MEGKEKILNIIFQERQIEEDPGGCTDMENETMDSFILYCCKNVPLWLDIVCYNTCHIYSPWIRRN